MNTEEQKQAYLDMSKASGIEEGDTVRVVSKCKSRQSGWYESWVPSMDDFVGNEYEVRNIGANGSIRIGWGFPCFVLEIVKKKDTAPKLPSLARYLQGGEIEYEPTGYSITTKRGKTYRCELEAILGNMDALRDSYEKRG